MNRLLVLVRHGQSDWNLKNLFTGWKDPGLTDARRRGGAQRRQAAQGAGLPSTSPSPRRCRGAKDARPHARGDRPAGPARRIRDQALNERDYGDLVRPQQGRCPQALGRGAGPSLAPLLRRAAAGRREPQGHRRPRAALLRPGDPAAGDARRARARRGARQLPARARHGARPADAADHPVDGTRHRPAARLSSQRGHAPSRRKRCWRNEREPGPIPARLEVRMLSAGTHAANASRSPRSLSTASPAAPA